MAIYHCSIKTVGRSQGRSATGAAAYRAGERIIDKRTGEIHDYRRKSGVEYTEIILPQGVLPIERGQLWNTAEAAENRKNSTVAREYELALPDELNHGQRKALALDFARHLADRYGVAADVAIHAPGRGGDHRNHHAHILTTTRQIAQGGELGAKTRSLDDRRSGEVEQIRATWGRMVNTALERAGHLSRVSHKSLEKQGINRNPGIHWGPMVTAMERRGQLTDRGQLHRELVTDQRSRAAEVELTAAERIAAGRARVKSKVSQHQAAQARAAELVRQRELDQAKAAKEAEIKAKLEEEKKAELQKEKQKVEKPRGRGGPGMGR